MEASQSSLPGGKPTVVALLDLPGDGNLLSGNVRLWPDSTSDTWTAEFWSDEGNEDSRAYRGRVWFRTANAVWHGVCLDCTGNPVGGVDMHMADSVPPPPDPEQP